MDGPSSTVDQNLLPVQAYFDVYGNFQTFIGQGQPFYAKINPIQSGLTITNSTIDSSPIGSFVPSTGVFTNISTTTGQVTTTPVNANDIANKFYVDTVAQGLGPKAACQCATTANITLSGLQTIDGYTTLAGDRVLVKNESSSQFNGIYIASSGAWTRATDMDTWSEVPGAYTVILNGGQAETGWVCTAVETGYINVTAMPWVQFSGANTYYAGTGLSLSANTFSISNTGVTAGSYGSASNTLSATVNAQGQLTALSATAIAIAASQITSGTIASSLISGSYTGITGVGTLTAGTWNATPITNSYLANSSITINGNAVSLGGSTTVTADTPNSLTFNNGGAGAASGTTFNGSVAQTISYNTIGAPSTSGTGASGTWNINITGNAATATSATSATTATTATNIAGGSYGSIPYQISYSDTGLLPAGTSGQLLVTLGSFAAPAWTSIVNLSSVTTATLITSGLTGYLYGNGSSAVTASTTIPTSALSGLVSLANGGTNANLTASAGSIAYSTSSALALTAVGTTGQVLTSNGTGAPTWTTPTSYATVTDDTTTNATRYPLFANQTTGNLTTEYTSSTKYQFNPSTGVLTATGFSGSGASLTSLTAGNLSGTIPSGVLGNSSLYIGTTAVPLNAASGSITSLAVNISGSASSATTATTATNANNVAVTDNTSSSATWYPTLVSTTTGNLPITTSSTKLSFVPSTGVLSANGVALTGNLGTVTSVSGTGSVNGITLTGTVTASGSLTLGGTLSGIGNSQLTNSSITIGGTAVSLGGTVGTLGVAYGGTGLTSLTAGYIPYGNGTSAFNSSSSLYFSGTGLGIGTSSVFTNALITAGNNSATPTGYGIVTLQNSGGVTPPSSVGLNVGWNFSNGGGENNLVFGTAAGSTPGLQISSYNGTTVTPVAKFDSSGNLLVGNTSNYGVGETNCIELKGQYVWANNNTGNILNRNWAAGVNGYAAGSWQLTVGSTDTGWPNAAYAFAVTSTGSCLNITGVYGVLSDSRLKNNVVPAQPVLSKLNQVEIVNYSLISENSTVPTKLGVIAQQVQTIFPNLIDSGQINPTDSTEYLTVKMSVFVPMAIKAIQELSAQITTLESRLAAANIA